MILIIAVLALALAGVLLLMRRLEKPRARSNSASSSAETYEGLRTLALTTEPATVGVEASADQTEAYGVLMDIALDNGKATVVGWESGEASIYTSTGGGFIGFGLTDKAVQDAARSWVKAAQDHLAAFSPTTSHPTASMGNISLYVVTTKGVVGVCGPVSEMEAGTHPAAAVWVGGQIVIDRIRRASAEAHASGTGQTLVGPNQGR